MPSLWRTLRIVVLVLATLQLLVFVMYWLLVPGGGGGSRADNGNGSLRGDGNVNKAQDAADVLFCNSQRQCARFTADGVREIDAGELKRLDLLGGIARVEVPSYPPVAVFLYWVNGKSDTGMLLDTLTTGDHDLDEEVGARVDRIVLMSEDEFQVHDKGDVVQLCQEANGDKGESCAVLGQEASISTSQLAQRYGIDRVGRVVVPLSLFVVVSDEFGRQLDILTSGLHSCTATSSSSPESQPVFCRDVNIVEYRAKLFPNLLNSLELLSWMSPDLNIRAGLSDDWQRTVTFNSDHTLVRLKGVGSMSAERQHAGVSNMSSLALQSGPTLVTQLSVSRLLRLVAIAKNWPGSMSIVVYLANPWDLLSLIEFWSEHVTQTTRAPQQMSWDEHTSRLSVSRVLLAAIWTIVKPDYRRPFQDYPINRLRNIGIHAAPTDVVFVIDADFVPDPLLFDRARSSIVPALEEHEDDGEQFAYVVNCVALTPTASKRPPRTMSELRDMVRTSQAELTSPVGHGVSKLGILLDLPFFNGRTNLALLNYYEVCFESQWEPYYFVLKSAPLYDERFTNQGGDKQQHALLLNAKGYRFRVVHSHYIYHLSHEASMVWPGGELRVGTNDKTFRYFEDYLPELENQYGRFFRLPNCPFAFTSNQGWIGDMYL